MNRRKFLMHSAAAVVGVAAGAGAIRATQPDIMQLTKGRNFEMLIMDDAMRPIRNYPGNAYTRIVPDGTNFKIETVDPKLMYRIDI